jgi:HEPN domain-containing protein
MSSKKHRITSVTREQARTYISKAIEFLRSAKEAMINGQHNSAGLLAIHAAISAADAALGHQVGYRSSSPDHRVAVELIKDIGSGTDE